MKSAKSNEDIGVSAYTGVQKSGDKRVRGWGRESGGVCLCVCVWNCTYNIFYN